MATQPQFIFLCWILDCKGERERLGSLFMFSTKDNNHQLIDAIKYIYFSLTIHRFTQFQITLTFKNKKMYYNYMS